MQDVSLKKSMNLILIHFYELANQLHTNLCLLLHGQGIVSHVAVVVVMLMVEAVEETFVF